MKILVISFLLGIDCKYNGKNNKNDRRAGGGGGPENCTLVEVQKNEDGSYVITVSGITGEIQTDITAHKHTFK